MDKSCDFCGSEGVELKDYKRYFHRVNSQDPVILCKLCSSSVTASNSLAYPNQYSDQGETIEIIRAVNRAANAVLAALAAKV